MDSSDLLLVGFDNSDKDIAVLVVSRKDSNNNIRMINAIQGTDATHIYENSLARIQKSEVRGENMPTGYTAYIEDGDITTGKDFLMLCSRAFGVAIDVRDEPLSVPTPTHFEPNPYYQKRYEDSVKELQVVKNMSFTEARDHMRAEHTSRVERAKRQLKMMEEINKKYENVRRQVEAWVPPSEEHNGIKEFALSQIDMCVYTPLMFDTYRNDIASELDESDEAVQKYMDELIKLSEDDVKRAKERCEAEVERAKQRTSFMQAFIESLENM